MMNAEQQDDRNEQLEEQEKTKPTQRTEDEQDGGYGWLCVVAMLLITAHTWGVNGVCGTSSVCQS